MAKEKFVIMGNELTESYPVKRGRFDSLTIYDVTAQELTIIENGSTNSLYLNFAIFLLSVSASFFASVFTVEWFPKNLEPHLISFIIFLIIAILTFLVGIVCSIVWWKTEDEFKANIKIIKNRLKAEKIENPDDEDSIEVEVGQE
ncbi:hypothetical protein [Tenacibaculum finnmarkense]|uniref:hypothetical protein n=1 Tax=Tenacibaculum finnmarkense TaxID=2781243 RepID=UPI001EFA8E98|nr:hypothetical protein [Tenacibaculum finnmarkense]MCG8208427.1 hypothetical protein [Tenacibaculum finnmarkense genomovar finnmarkense]MCG8724374.1 hypothetical protein [Tenacibaculum finnmarkense]MCG8742681.1 hypothetical protein [Tenacibaculum finnmarkense]MCG8766098.1 hypothetical protein [Tenacibaculum finnmarkense]MCG8779048.1 hypothetical protein [Tenacibaculum finnmarkense]